MTQVSPLAPELVLSRRSEEDDGGERPLGPALRNGWRLKCPRCGQGPLMRAYLKTHDHCVVCDEPLHHHRADDGPAYTTILVGGHVMAPFLMATYTFFDPNPLVVAVGFSTAFTGFSLWMLPRMKGLFVAFQWAKRMHGFGEPVGTDAPIERKNDPEGAEEG